MIVLREFRKEHSRFDIFINGQYIDKSIYTWTPSIANTATQTIEFNSTTLGYSLEATDTIIIKGRWAS